MKASYNKIKGFEKIIKSGDLKKSQEEIIFDEWNEVKKDLSLKKVNKQAREGEVWWCGVGKNVGSEINGKSQFFSRPVLIYKRYSEYLLKVIPVTSKEHTPPFYYHTVFEGRDQYLALHQSRTISSSRVYSRICELRPEKFQKIKQAWARLNQ